MKKYFFMAVFIPAVLAMTGCPGDSNVKTAEPVPVELLRIEVNGREDKETTTKLKLEFDYDIPGLKNSDITFSPGTSGAVKGALVKVAAKYAVYELALEGIKAKGQVKVKVNKNGYRIKNNTQTIIVHYLIPGQTGPVDVQFTGLSQNGEEDAISTSLLTLQFDKDIENLLTTNITFNPGTTGAKAGVFLSKASGETGRYTLPVTGVTKKGDVTIKVNKPNYSILPDSRTVTVFPPKQVEFISLGVNGQAGAVTTSKLIITLDKDINNFTSADILVSGMTGLTKGNLIKTGGVSGVYELGITGIKSNGSLTVTLVKNDHVFLPASRSAAVHYVSTNSVKIYGLPNAGQTLTVQADLSGSGSYAYQWSSGGVNVTGAAGTGRTYRVLTSDAGKEIKVTVSRDGNSLSAAVNAKTALIIQITTFTDYSNSTPIRNPEGITADSKGNVYFMQRDPAQIGKIDALTGSITVLSNSGFNVPWGLAIDKNGDYLYAASKDNSSVIKVAVQNGTSQTYLSLTAFGDANSPHGITVADNGVVYVSSNRDAVTRQGIFKIVQEGIAEHIAGNRSTAITINDIRNSADAAYGPGLQIGFANNSNGGTGVKYIVVRENYLYISDGFTSGAGAANVTGSVIRRVKLDSQDYIVSNFAFSGDNTHYDGNILDGNASSQSQTSIAFGPDGSLYMRCHLQNIRVIKPNGDTYTIDLHGTANEASSPIYVQGQNDNARNQGWLAVDKDGNIWASSGEDALSKTHWIKKLSITIPE